MTLIGCFSSDAESAAASLGEEPDVDPEVEEVKSTPSPPMEILFTTHPPTDANFTGSDVDWADFGSSRWVDFRFVLFCWTQITLSPAHTALNHVHTGLNHVHTGLNLIHTIVNLFHFSEPRIHWTQFTLD